MKIRVKNDNSVHEVAVDLTGQLYLAPAGFLRILMAAGLIEQVAEPPVKRVPQTTWSAVRTLQTGTRVITFSCETCKQSSAWAESWMRPGKPTVHKKTWFHCGVEEPVPDDVQQAYLELFAKRPYEPSMNEQIRRQEELQSDVGKVLYR